MDNINRINIIDGLLAFNLVHVVEQIFLLLDNDSLMSAELASARWQYVIQASQQIYRSKLIRISSWFFGGNSDKINADKKRKISYGSTFANAVVTEE